MCNEAQEDEANGAVAAPVEPLVSHFVYVFGEGDGPFKCEHMNSGGHANCSNKTWSIFTETKMEPTRAMCAGIALCAAHQPSKFEPGGHSLSSMIKAAG
jgi:hypothetical protein